jgi:hypothetical protein
MLLVAGSSSRARGIPPREAKVLRSPNDADALTHAGVHIRLVKGACVKTETPTPTMRRPMSPTCSSPGWLRAEAGEVIEPLWQFDWPLSPAPLTT